MSNALQFALSNPVPGMETEFNEWYGGSHFDHGVETPGIHAGQRFRRADGPWPSGKHDFLMVWEMDDPAFVLSELDKVKGTADMPISPSIDMTTVQPPTMWKRAEVWSSARPVTNSTNRGSIVFALYRATGDEDPAFTEALMSGGLAALADLPGVARACYLTLADEQIRGNARKFPHGLLLELADETAGVVSLAAPLTKLSGMDPEKWQATLFQGLGTRRTKADLALEAK